MIGGPGDRIGWCPNCSTIQWRRAARRISPSWCDSDAAGCVTCDSAWGIDILAAVCGWCATPIERQWASSNHVSGSFPRRLICQHVPTQPWDALVDSGDLAGPSIAVEVEHALALLSVPAVNN
jgi:hypothetical protein